MKKLTGLFCAGALVCALFVGCSNDNDNSGRGTGLGEEIQGIEIKQATGTIIGHYFNGFGSLLVQVDEEFLIGKTIEYYPPSGYNIPSWHVHMPEAGTYLNMIQVQCKLPVKTGNKISFSVRKFQGEKDKDIDLFIFGNGISRWDTAAPDVPTYVITKYKILND